MTPSRRTTSRRTALGSVGTAALTLVAGCSQVLDGRSADRSTPGDEAVFRVRLRGPETDRTLFTGTAITTVGTVRPHRGAYVLPIALSSQATAHVIEVFGTAGVADNPDAFEVVQIHDGREITRFGVAPGLAEAIATGEWDGRLRLTFDRRDRATRLRETLVTELGVTKRSPTPTTDRPAANDALAIISHLAVEGTMVNVGVEGTAKNTASIPLVECVIDVTGEVGGQTFTGHARRDRLAASETWAWEVSFGEEADALQDNAVENISIGTRAEYAG